MQSYVRNHFISLNHIYSVLSFQSRYKDKEKYRDKGKNDSEKIFCFEKTKKIIL